MSFLLRNHVVCKCCISRVGEQHLGMVMHLRNEVEGDPTILVHRLVLIAPSPHTNLTSILKLSLLSFFEGRVACQVQLTAFSFNEFVILFIKHKPKSIKRIQLPMCFLHSLLFLLPTFFFVILKISVGTHGKVFRVTSFTASQHISLWTKIWCSLALSILSVFASSLPFVLGWEKAEESTIVEVDFFHQLLLLLRLDLKAFAMAEFSAPEFAFILLQRAEAGKHILFQGLEPRLTLLLDRLKDGHTSRYWVLDTRAIRVVVGLDCWLLQINSQVWNWFRIL